MIHVYALSYLLTDYIKCSLTSILETATEPLCITIVDNKSEASNEIFKYIKPLIDIGKIKRYIQLKENVQIMAFNQAYALFPPDSSEDFCVLTELDVVVQNNLNWVGQVRDMMQNHTICGFRLSLENYGPPHGGHQDDGINSGFWLMGLNIKRFNELPKQTAINDGLVRRWMTLNNGRIIQNKNTLYHLGWNSHIDYPEYFEKKVRLGKRLEQWNTHKKSDLEFIYER